VDCRNAQRLKHRHADAEVYRGFVLGEATNDRERESGLIHRSESKKNISTVPAAGAKQNPHGRATAGRSVGSTMTRPAPVQPRQRLHIHKPSRSV
jgi:hypothetical protein